MQVVLLLYRTHSKGTLKGLLFIEDRQKFFYLEASFRKCFVCRPAEYLSSIKDQKGFYKDLQDVYSR